jgi:ubiquitin C-terminal hydrolase
MDYPNKISKGLANLGNTCFFNSILQLMYQCTVLNKLLVSNNINGTLINYYKDYINSYINSNNMFQPNNIVQHVSSLLGRNGFQQEDADQYITFIIDTIIDEFKDWAKASNINLIPNKNMSLIDLVTSLFTIKIEKELICPNCNYVSKTNDDINKLYLSLDHNNQNQNLDDLINNYTFETLDDNNKWKCDKCNNRVNATIKRVIKKLPKYLIITLKRYKNNNIKIDNPILMPYNYTYINKNYSMRGFVLHSGSTGGGHYVYYGNRDDSWYLYDDASVSSIDNNSINNISKYGYVYLYVCK